MRIVLALLISIVLGIGTAHASDALNSSGPLAKSMAGKRILLVSAHPDDEGLFSPLMAEVCRFGGATCHMVVAADANSPGCMLSLKMDDWKKCSAMRRQETAASAANLNATHEFYGWDDLLVPWNDAGVDRNIKQWADSAGGQDKLVARLTKSFNQFNPDFVLGFDPRHGTTCHPGHRAIVLLALEAIDHLPAERRPQVWLESDFAVPTSAPPELAPIIEAYGIVPWPGDKTPITWHDAGVALPNGRTGWDYLVDSNRLNATQFPEIATGKLTPNPPAQNQRIPFVRLADINPQDRGMCEKYTPEFSLSF